MPIITCAMSSDDIMREFGLVKVRASNTGSFGTFESMCKGKTKHETKTSADRASRRMKGLVSFHCRYCHGWHVGNHLDH